MNLLNKENISLRLQQLIILVLHLILLKWMYYTLAELGTEKTSIVLVHYIGMSIYGAALIRGCAAWGKYHYQQDLKQEKKNDQ
ncbi:MAG: hypothetical protein K9K67_05840 [Bacteriovoracaceae bacterium]|nr:hypothetical protein [Bacteriovoracaceae bacterium]